jgi:hypothetical protein
MKQHRLNDLTTAPVDKIDPSPFQSRTVMHAETIEELAASLSRRLLLFGVPLALLGGLGVGAWVLIPGDPLRFQGELWKALEKRHGGEEALSKILARRFHRGGGWCWRYQSPTWTEEERDQVADRLFEAGVAQEMSGDVYGLVEKWTAAADERHHSASRVEERMQFLSENVRGVERLVFRLNEGRIRRAVSDFLGELEARREAMARRSSARLSPRHRRLVRSLWQEHPKVMSPSGLFGMELSFKRRITVQRLDRVVAAIKAWIVEHGAPPKSLAALALEDPLNYDGYGVRLRYAVGERAVTVFSTGFDGMPSKDDLVRRIDVP